MSSFRLDRSQRSKKGGGGPLRRQQSSPAALRATDISFVKTWKHGAVTGVALACRAGRCNGTVMGDFFFSRPRHEGTVGPSVLIEKGPPPAATRSISRQRYRRVHHWPLEHPCLVLMVALCIAGTSEGRSDGSLEHGGRCTWPAAAMRVATVNRPTWASKRRCLV